MTERVFFEVLVIAASRIILRAFIAVSLVLSLLSFVSVSKAFFAINASAGAYHFGGHVIALVALAIVPNLYSGKIRALLAVALIGLAVRHAWRAVPFYYPSVAREDLTGLMECNGASTSPCRLRILYANIHGSSNWQAQLIQLIETRRPNVVSLVEPTARWVNALKSLPGFPYRIDIPREDMFGLALLSEFPLGEGSISSMGENLPPVILTSLVVPPGHRIYLGVYHAFPPHSNEAVLAAKVYMRRIATYFRHLDSDVILLGDLNATPFSFVYRRFVTGARVKSAMEGFGLWRSWHAGNPFLRFALDHVFYRGGLEVIDFKTLSAAESDHFPLEVDFAVKTP